MMNDRTKITARIRERVKSTLLFYLSAFILFPALLAGSHNAAVPETFAEVNQEEKNAVSHRARACEAMIALLREEKP